MIAKYLFFIFILLATLLESIGDITLKKWAIESRNFFLISGFIIYFIAIIFWAISLKYGYLSKAISIVMILNVILVVLAGIFMFKEDLSLINKIGIGLGIISIILIEL